MATFNGERFILAQLRSILAQLGPADEVVIADDASADGTVALIRGLDDPRIRLVQHPTNRGVLAAFESALRHVRGRYVFLADQDDVWLSDKVSTLLEHLESRPEALLALSDASVIDRDGQTLHPSFMALRGGFQPGLLSNFLRNRYLGCTMLMRRALLDRSLPIPAAVPMHDMWFGWMAATAGPLVYVSRPLMLYRRHDTNASPMRRQSLLQMASWRVALVASVVGRLISLRRRSPPAS
jgi:glycosyltransferase involved in cell wall biosynthesis